MTSLSSRFFNSLANKDYDELTQLYGEVAIQALLNYQNVQMRWNQRVRSSNKVAREEKFDDSCYSPPSDVIEINNLVKRQDGGSYGKMNAENMNACGDLLREFSAFIRHPEQFVGESLAVLPTITQWDLEQLVRDAVSSLTEIRPPADFAIFPGGVVFHNTANGTDSVASIEISANGDAVGINSLSLDQLPPSGPPIFDGAVANATPSFGTNGGGGLGTSIHAVAALNHPLTMALLLVMGADARACHTAFRRLVQHEAACNGSIECLTLLLELGNQYGEELTNVQSTSFHQPEDQSKNEKQSTAPSPDSISEFPFFPTRRADISRETLNSLHSKPMKLWNKPESPSNDTQRPMNILSLLRAFVSLVKQTENGAVSDLDAARMLVQKASLSYQTKTALAIQCGYNVRSDCITTNISPFHRRSLNTVSSDGHGNTPLHWAAFKNESACVSLLLKYHADPNARAQPSGWTPLHDAAYSNGREAIALLIDAGAIVDARASSGATPLCFAAQEDAAEAAELLLIRGADLGTRCSADAVIPSVTNNTTDNNVIRPNPPQTRFSGYTPLHYCAHYNASKAAKILLQHHTAIAAMEIRDLNNRLPIHVAVARGSSNVLRELLKAGARVETRSLHRHHSATSSSPTNRSSRRRETESNSNAVSHSEPSTPRRSNSESTSNVSATTTARDAPITPPRNERRNRSRSISIATPVSSPLLRAMIPSQPVQSSKPWNCLSQRSIDECRQLISEVEQNWTPDRHSLFTPSDRRAVAELLRVGKRLEAEGSLSFIDLWPEVLSFCGRGWFEVDEDDTEVTDTEYIDDTIIGNDNNHTLSLPTFC